MIFKVTYRLAGSHYHCSLFTAASPSTTFAKCGDFVLRMEEWEEFRSKCPALVFEERSPVASIAGAKCPRGCRTVPEPVLPKSGAADLGYTHACPSCGTLFSASRVAAKEVSR